MIETVAKGLDLLELAARVLASDTHAWHELWQQMEPRIWAVTGRWQVTGPLCRSADDRREIVLKVMARLREAGFRRLGAFMSSAGGQSEAAFVAWLHTLATRVAVDHARAHPERLGRGEASRWVRLVSIDDVPPPIATADLAGQAMVLSLLERARSELSIQQLTALSLWLEGESNTAIARRLGVREPEEAHRIVRAALKRLRDRYRTAETAEPRAMEESS